MRRVGRVLKAVMFTSIVCLCAGTFPRSAFAACQGLLDQFNEALAARDLPRLKQLENSIAAEPECGRAVVLDARRRRTAVELLAAQNLRDRNGPADKYERLVVDADKSDVS